MLASLDLIVKMYLVRTSRGRTPGTISTESIPDIDEASVGTTLPYVKDAAIDHTQAKELVCVLSQLITFSYPLLRLGPPPR